MAGSRRSLGRGLDALLGPPGARADRDDYFLCSLDRLHPDPNQPREQMDDEALAELAQSIREKGVLQPLLVRHAEPEEQPADASEEAPPYIVVAGERRLRAAREVGLDEVPVLVRDVASHEALELALIENLQRQDLNPLEEARAYQRLLDRPEMTQDVLAQHLGKDRSTLSNALRLLQLDEELQPYVVDRRITPGHARALLGLPDAERRGRLADRVVKQGLSVRGTEQAARRLKDEGRKESSSGRRRENPLQPYCDGIAAELTEALDTRVHVRNRGRRGRITIEFNGLDDLRRLRDRLKASD